MDDWQCNEIKTTNECNEMCFSSQYHAVIAIFSGVEGTTCATHNIVRKNTRALSKSCVHLGRVVRLRRGA